MASSLASALRNDLRKLFRSSTGFLQPRHLEDVVNWVEKSAALLPVVVSDTAAITAEYGKVYLINTNETTKVVTVTLPATTSNDLGHRIGIIYASQTYSDRLNQRVDIVCPDGHSVGGYSTTLHLYVSENAYRDNVVLMSGGASSTFWLVEDGRTQLRWDDYEVSATGINPPGAASDPSRNTTTGLLEFSGNLQNSIVVYMQLRHRWRQGTPVYPHTHWAKTTSASGLVLWECKAEIWRLGTTLGSPTTVQNSTPEVSDGDTAHQHALTPVGPVSLSDDVDLSDIIKLTLSRRGDLAGDTYDGVVSELISFDTHFLSDFNGGSYELYNKNPTTPTS